MTARSDIDIDFFHGRLTLTRAQLNPPFYVQSDRVFAITLKNHGDTPLLLKDVSFNCEGFVEGSAVMYFHGERIPLSATATKNKITLEGNEIPPRESVIIFYRVNKGAD